MSILEFVLLFVLPSFPGFVMGAGLIEFGFGVEQFLDFKTALLFFFLGADTAVGRHPQLAHRVFPSGAFPHRSGNLNDSHVAHGFSPYTICPFCSLNSI